MKTLIKTIAVAALLCGASGAALAAPAKPAPAAAPSGGAGVNGIAIANLEAVVYNSLAFKTAQVQRETQFKAQIDAAKAKEVELNGQLKPLVEKFQKDRAAPNAAANQAALQAQVQQIQALQESGKAAIEKIVEPVRLSDAYVLEQISDKRGPAVVAAMQKSGVSLLLNPDAVIHVTNNAYNLNQAILDELNKILPSVQLVPPAGWVPRDQREQQQGQQAPQQAAESR